MPVLLTNFSTATTRFYNSAYDRSRPAHGRIRQLVDHRVAYNVALVSEDDGAGELAIDKGGIPGEAIGADSSVDNVQSVVGERS